MQFQFIQLNEIRTVRHTQDKYEPLWRWEKKIRFELHGESLLFLTNIYIHIHRGARKILTVEYMFSMDTTIKPNQNVMYVVGYVFSQKIF
jgi:hypothetical protein